MNRNGWKRLGVLVATIALVVSILGSLVALAYGYGELRAKVRHNAEKVGEVRETLPQMQEDIKELLRGVGKIKGKLGIDGE